MSIQDAIKIRWGRREYLSAGQAKGTPGSVLNMGEFLFNQATKKQLFEIYNDVNKMVYGFGTSESKIFFVDNMIVFSVQHNRVPCLMALEDDYLVLKETVDAAIMNVFKERLRKELEERLGLHTKAVLRDYAYGCLTAVTVVILDNN